MSRSSTWKFAVVAIGLLAIGADEPKETVSVKGIKFDIPKTWKTGKPATAMRVAQFKVDPAEGDTEPAELVLFAFKGGGGSVKDNLVRWQAQFQDKDGKPPEITTEVRKGKNAEVTFAAASGRYVAAVTPGSSEKYDKLNWGLLGAIVQTPDTGFYFKLIGPEKTLKANKPAFDALIKSIAVGDE